MRILITGGKGQLAFALKREFEDHLVYAPAKDELDITDFEKLVRVVKEFRPHMLINPAALTAVDHCEDVPEQAFMVNGVAPGKMAELADKHSFIIVHISTDYVFSGEKRAPYVEEDPTFPLSVYGNSKLVGENLVRVGTEKHYVIRTAGLFGPGGKGNFVKFVLENVRSGRRLKIVNDRYSSPTYTLELALQIRLIIEKELPYGIYHATSEGECNWFEFARKIVEITGEDMNLVKPVSSEEFVQKARRPQYSVLENRKLKSHRINIFSHCFEALKKYLKSEASVD